MGTESVAANSGNPGNSGNSEKRTPRLSIPGGLILAVCAFLPAVRDCGKPVYPYQVPVVCGPYLFGLLIAVLALLPASRKALALCGAAWALAVASAAAQIYGFIHGYLQHDKIFERFLWAEVLLWLPLTVLCALSARYFRDVGRWRVQLLWIVGGLNLCFFSFWILNGPVYFGMWLSLATCPLLIAEGILASRRLAARPQ